MRNLLLSAAAALMAGTTFAGTVQSAELPKGAAHNIVLVHGAFVDQTSWKPVADILKSKGYNVTLVENPLTSSQRTLMPPSRRLRSRAAGPSSLATHGVA